MAVGYDVRRRPLQLVRIEAAAGMGQGERQAARGCRAVGEKMIAFALPLPIIRYILNVLNDSTWGLLLVYFMIKKSTAFVRRKRIKLIYSGQYGRPPQYKVRLVLFGHAGALCAANRLVTPAPMAPFSFSPGWHKRASILPL